MSRLALASRPSTTRAAIPSAVAAALLLAAAVATGTIDSTNTTLVVMGFDPDRAQLITALLVGGLAAAASLLVAGRLRLAVVCGLVATAAVFGPTFIGETQTALSSSGFQGSFDPAGWALTLLTLLVVGTISSWAGATLGAGIRPALVALAAQGAAATRSGRLNHDLAYRSLSAVGILALLTICVPVFGDMVNFAPDAHMVRGGPPPAGLVPAPGQASAAPSTGTVDGPAASGTNPPTPAATGTAARPWLAWLPTGAGGAVTVQLPAPWTGGTATTDGVTIYTPPGYDAAGARRYPVLYEAPKQFHDWDTAAHISTVLDGLIDTGAIPPMIVVFVADIGGPYPDTECANSVDGRQWMDTFIARTVVSYVDGHFRTIADPSARAIVGFSQGGYCAAILALHHPDVFGTSIPMSGYFEAGQGDPTSGLPFGGRPAAMAAASPSVVAPQLPPSARTNLYFIVVASPTQPFYGAQSADFVKLLAREGYPYVAVSARAPHGWVQVREQFPGAVEAWAARLVHEAVV
jgi:hypothetical protein